MSPKYDLANTLDITINNLLHWPVIILKQIKRLILRYRFGEWDTESSRLSFSVSVFSGGS